MPAVDRLLRVIMERNGATTAKGARSVMSGMVGVAMRYGAMTTNPTRDVATIRVQKKTVRALTADETELLVKKLRADTDTMRLDLVDLVEFMLGEARGSVRRARCVCHRSTLWAEGVEISATAMAFDRGTTQDQGGWRVIAVPPNVVQILRRRVDSPELRTDVAIFPRPIGRVRESSKTTADLRRALSDAVSDG